MPGIIIRRTNWEVIQWDDGYEHLITVNVKIEDQKINFNIYIHEKDIDFHIEKRSLEYRAEELYRQNSFNGKPMIIEHGNVYEITWSYMYDIEDNTIEEVGINAKSSNVSTYLQLSATL